MNFGSPPFPLHDSALAIPYFSTLCSNHPFQETQHSSQTALPSAVLAQARGGVGEIIQAANRAFGAPGPCRGKKRLSGHVRQGIWSQTRLFALPLSSKTSLSLSPPRTYFWFPPLPTFPLTLGGGDQRLAILEQLFNEFVGFVQLRFMSSYPFPEPRAVQVAIAELQRLQSHGC